MNEFENFENIYEVNSIDELYDQSEMQTQEIIPIEYFKYTSCQKDIYLIKDFEIIYNIVRALPLSNIEKNILLVRFRRINMYCIKNFKSLANYYTKSKLFIIICGILNPSLLSINLDAQSAHYYAIFWTVWCFQLSVSIVTSFISFYKWDKKYFLYNSYKSRINQEIWYYLELTGKYNKSIVNHDYENKKHVFFEPNHKNKLHVFLESIEALFKKLKDFDLEIENNQEESKENKNTMKFVRSAVNDTEKKKSKGDENV